MIIYSIINLICVSQMTDGGWIDQYKRWRDLKPHQIKLLEDGAHSQSQAWLLNQMWCDWQKLKKLKETELPAFSDPWEDTELLSLN